MSDMESADDLAVQAIIENAVDQAEAAIAAYEMAETEMEAAATAIDAGFQDGWEQLYSLPKIAGLLELTAAWNRMLDQLMTPKDRSLPWFAPHAANFHWRAGRALMDPKRYEEAEHEFDKALAAHRIAWGDQEAAGHSHYLKRLHEWRGFCRVHQGKPAKAREDFLTQLSWAIAADERAHIMSIIAAVDWQLGERDVAVARVQDALKVLREDGEAHVARIAHLERSLVDMRRQM